ncbi:MAG: energy-converting hydrogenase B subunit G, EhbG [Methanobacteriaceae archaeon]
MNLYDTFIKIIKNRSEKIKSAEESNNISVSSILAAETTLIITALITAIILRHVSILLTIIIILGLLLVLLTNMPLMPSLKKEQNDSMGSMLFYVIITLGILITVFYWGVIYV